MLFSSYVFVFAFLPITVIGYFLLSRIKSHIPQKVFLITASLVFYAWFEWKYIFLISSSIVVNFLCASLINKFTGKILRKIIFIAVIIFNILLLGYFKYFDFLIETVNSVLSTDFTLKNIVLPLGISFFTFQQISFQLYVYKNRQQKLNFINYTLFVSFFAQLVAGPIIHYEELVPQIEKAENRKFNSENFSKGTYIFVTGLFKKLVIADSISVIVDNGFSKTSELGFFPAWIVMFGYAFQIYFDFSGYSDMAIGLGKMFNYDIPVNFNSPYRSLSVTDFWKTWHITLGTTLRETVYIPLGGSRKGKPIKCLNLFIVFLVSGIWHGASWTFVIWGILHGLARVFEEIFGKALSKIPDFLRRTFTFLFVSAAFTVFRAENFGEAFKVYKGMVNFSDFGISQIASLANDGIVALPSFAAVFKVVLMLAVCFIIVFKCKNSYEKFLSFKPSARNAVLCAIELIISVLCMSRSAVFIYFNF